MKLKRKTMILGAAVSASLIFSVFTLAADSQYDSAADPLISYSYLEDRIAEIKSEYQSEITSLTLENEALKTEIDAIKAQLAALGNISAGPSQSSGITSDEASDLAYEAVGFKPIFFECGDVISPATESIELILRSGRAKVISPFVDQGVSNITNGTDVLNDKSLVYNHLIIIPRKDGRGIEVTSPNGAYIMVRGEYTVGE